MFIRYQLYKGYIIGADYDLLNKIEKDIKSDVLNNVLDDDLANRLLNLIADERKYKLKVTTI